jgi:hypothetical protein
LSADQSERTAPSGERDQGRLPLDRDEPTG